MATKPQPVMDTVFKRYPLAIMYYQTVDGQSFLNHHDALLHAKNLKQRQIKTIYRNGTTTSKN
jgi:hypothetical protein